MTAQVRIGHVTSTVAATAPATQHIRLGRVVSAVSAPTPNLAYIRLGRVQSAVTGAFRPLSYVRLGKVRSTVTPTINNPRIRLGRVRSTVGPNIARKAWTGTAWGTTLGKVWLGSSWGLRGGRQWTGNAWKDFAVTVTGPPVTPPPVYTRPTGTGFYRIEDLVPAGSDGTWFGQLQPALSAVTSQSVKTPSGYWVVTLPAGVFTSPGFTQANVPSSAQGFTYLAPNKVGVVGSGPGVTFIQTTPNSMTVPDATTIKNLTNLANNNFFTICFNHADAAPIGQFTITQTPQNTGNGTYPGIYYGGLRSQYAVGGNVFDVAVKTGYGYLNSPPGETYQFCAHQWTGGTISRVTTDGRDSGGTAQSAVGVYVGSGTNVTLTDITTIHSGYSHGIVGWHQNGLVINRGRSEYNGQGAGSGGGGGTTGASVNFESCQNTTVQNFAVGNNTLCDIRYYSDGSVVTDTTGHYLKNVAITDGRTRLVVDLGNKQQTAPIIQDDPAGAVTPAVQTIRLGY